MPITSKMSIAFQIYITENLSLKMQRKQVHLNLEYMHFNQR